MGQYAVSARHRIVIASAVKQDDRSDARPTRRWARCQQVTAPGGQLGRDRLRARVATVSGSAGCRTPVRAKPLPAMSVVWAGRSRANRARPRRPSNRPARCQPGRTFSGLALGWLSPNPPIDVVGSIPVNPWSKTRCTPVAHRRETTSGVLGAFLLIQATICKLQTRVS